MAWMAKIPVLDPASPQEARAMGAEAFRISERFRIPVMLRSVTRLSHARQDVEMRPVRARESSKARFVRDVARWAATPRYRYILHRELNQKLARLAHHSERLTRLAFPANGKIARLGIIASGVPFQIAQEILLEQGIHHVPLLKLAMPFPLPQETVARFMAHCRRVLVLEEPDALIEFLLPSRTQVLGRTSGHVPLEGEILPEVAWDILDRALRTSGLKRLPSSGSGGGIPLDRVMKEAKLPQRRPTLCAGCPHRASFYSIKRAFPKAIFTSDIGCYTLGANLGGVDTVLDMGSGITLASGLYQAFHQDGSEQPIIATMGDSTFYHSGTAALLNAVYNGARFVLVILDNEVTAMTGMQPTPGTGRRADGSMGRAVPLERVLVGCGVDFLEIHDPYDMKGLIRLLKKAYDYALSPEGGVAVVISRHPCLIALGSQRQAALTEVVVSERCRGCRHCLEAFECPALIWNPSEERVWIDPALCADCGVCLDVCPRRAIQRGPGEAKGP